MFSYKTFRENARLYRYKAIKEDIYVYAIMLKALKVGVLSSGITDEEVYDLFRENKIIPVSNSFAYQLAHEEIRGIVPLICNNICESDLIQDRVESMQKLFEIARSNVGVAERYLNFFVELGFEYACAINIPNIVTNDTEHLLRYYSEGGIEY